MVLAGFGVLAVSLQVFFRLNLAELHLNRHRRADDPDRG
jgi:hypothetical protein